MKMMIGLIVTGFLIVFVSSVDAQESQQLDEYQLEAICAKLDENLPMALPCNFNARKTIIDIVLRAGMSSDEKYLYLAKACELGSAYIISAIGEVKTSWTMYIYTMESGRPVGVCDLS